MSDLQRKTLPAETTMYLETTKINGFIIKFHIYLYGLYAEHSKIWQIFSILRYFLGVRKRSTEHLCNKYPRIMEF